MVLSTQHNPEVSLKDLREATMELIVKHTLPAELLHKDTQYHINPTGNFVIGGPVGDCGLTGRKIIVDTYVVWRVMVAVRSLVKTHRKWIAVPPMLAVMWRKYRRCRSG